MDAKILCDGCWEPAEILAVAVFMAEGIQVRYCDGCKDLWVAFKTACDAHAAKLQREHELWELDARRTKLKLLVTPLDFPKVALSPTGDPVTLR